MPIYGNVTLKLRTNAIVRFLMTFSGKFGGITWINEGWLCTRWLRFWIAVMALRVIVVTNLRQPFPISVNMALKLRTNAIVRFLMTFSGEFGVITWINVPWLCIRWLSFLIAVTMLDVIHVTNLRHTFRILRGVNLNLGAYAIVRVQMRLFSCDYCLYAYRVFLSNSDSSVMCLTDGSDPFINNNFTLRYQYHYLSIRF